MNKISLRKPAVAGQFYPGTSQELKKQIERFLEGKPGQEDALGCVLPHAGYIYSGRVAVETVSRIKIKEKIVLLGPNHTGFGADFSIMTEGAWLTPLGEVKIDSGLSQNILQRSKYLKEDISAHAYEHCLEVELPILQYFKADFEIVPLVFLSDDLEVLKEIGREIASSIKESNLQESTMIVASSDLTHYEPQGQAERKDQEAIRAILELDADKLMEKVRRLNISMCGYAPVITMLSATKALGAKKAVLVRYQTSGEVTQDMAAVVGYAGIIIY